MIRTSVIALLVTGVAGNPDAPSRAFVGRAANFVVVDLG
jgi:hypothetical protein